MTKKMYKKPQTEKVNLEAEIRCEGEIVAGSGGNPSKEKWSN